MRYIRRRLDSPPHKTILVTGDRGFVGKHLVRRLLNDDARPSPVIVGIDLKDGEDIRDCHLPDADKVYHLAAFTDARSSDSKQIYESNVLGSIRVFEHYKSKVVFASSSMVNYPQSSPYAQSKAIAEVSAKMHGCAIVRFCNLFGPDGHSCVDKFREGNEIVIHGDGEQVRTYTHVGHAIRALVDAVPGRTTILDGHDWSVNQIAQMYGIAKKVRHVATPPWDLKDGRQVRDES